LALQLQTRAHQAVLRVGLIQVQDLKLHQASEENLITG